ncbi:MAG: tetratricopeptide repeat protein [Gammaproteobacteria bacterium]|nr:tetratricopeptide repeat protein [Gammaproteobacteria bacterium]
MSADGRGQSGDVADRLRGAVERHQAGHPSDALPVYQEFLGIQPENADVLNLAGVACAQLGDAEQAIHYLSRAVSCAPGFPDANRNLALALRDTGRFEEAVAAHQRLIDAQPDSFEAYNDLGITWRRLGKLGKAADAYRRALTLAPDFVDAMVNLGNVLQDQDRIEEACKRYEEAIALNPSLPSVHRSLGNALQRLGRIEEAVESYRRAVSLDQNYARAHADLGSALVEQGMHEEGVTALRRAAALSPDASNIHSNLGMALHHLGDPASSLAAYDESLRLEPGNSHALAYKSIALLALGMIDEYRSLVDYDKLLYAEDVVPPPGYASLDEFNRVLGEFAATHPTLMGKDDRRPGITGELLAEPEGPMRDLDALVRKAAAEYIGRLPGSDPHPFIARRPGAIRMIGWATVLDGGADAHIHPHAWLSGVYYVKTVSACEAGEGEENDGFIEFGRPDPKFDLTESPEFRVVRPREGLMLLFPSFFWHRVRDFRSKEKRISYAFDIFPA